MEYSKDGRFIGYDDGKGAKSYGYNNQGLLTSVENQQGTLLSIKYNALDHPVEVLQPNGVTVANTFNAAGQLLTRTNPDGGEQEWTYNQRGLSTFEFETVNNVFKTTTYLRDELGRVTKTTTANGEEIEYAYDEASSITDLWDGAGNKSTWEYDNEGRVVKVYDATSTLILQYSYDDESRLNWRWSKGKGTTYYTFDKNNNLININYPSGTADITYGYDVLNRLTNMVDAVGTTAFAYNNRGLLSSENGPWSSDTVEYEYAFGYLDKMRLERPSTSDWVVEYDYDSSTRLDEIISPVGTFSYDYVGNKNKKRT
jgi:YD repeat-containing protein